MAASARTRCVAFWMSYVLTRPLGASFADYFSKPHRLSGVGFGNGPTAVVCFAAVAALVGYLIVRAPGHPERRASTGAAMPPCHGRASLR